MLNEQSLQRLYEVFTGTNLSITITTVLKTCDKQVVQNSLFTFDNENPYVDKIVTFVAREKLLSEFFDDVVYLDEIEISQMVKELKKYNDKNGLIPDLNFSLLAKDKDGSWKFVYEV